MELLRKRFHQKPKHHSGGELMDVNEMFDEKLSRRGPLKGAAGSAGIAALAAWD